MKVSDAEKKNQIALSLIEGVGDKIGKKLLAYFGSAKAIQQQIFIELSPDEQKIIDLLAEKELHIDLIVESLDWGFSKVANELLQAEFKDLIISLPGKIYKKNI